MLAPSIKISVFFFKDVQITKRGRVITVLQLEDRINLKQSTLIHDEHMIPGLMEMSTIV